MTKEDSDDLGFAVCALNFGAVSLDEFKQWCLHAIERTETNRTPPFLYELADFSRAVFHIYDVIGFVPTWRSNQDEENALFGIAAVRGRLADDSGLSRDQALAALLRNPDVRARFEEAFPFIAL